MAAVIAVAACDSGPQGITAPGPERIKLGTEQNYMDYGDYVVHVNALTTNQLPAQVAEVYGIVRSDSSAMLNVSVLKKDASQPSGNVAVVASVAVAAANLTGQLKTMELREVREGNSIYYIGDVSIDNQETLRFDIDVLPEGSDEELLLSFSRKFYTD